MKRIFAFFTLCLMAVNSATINYESEIGGVVSQMEQIAFNAAAALEHQIERTLLEPMQHVEMAVESLHGRRNENEECFDAQEQNIVDIVDAMNNEMTQCGSVAAMTSAEIVSDVGAAVQQLVFNGYNLLRTYQRCQNITNSILQRSCYARLSEMAVLYMNNARKSIATIQESTNERIPAVASDANVCTNTAAEIAVQQLDNINANLDGCIEMLV